MRIVFYMTSLDTGGAERQVVLLAEGLERAGHEVTVVTMYPGGQYHADLSGSSSVDTRSLYAKRAGTFVRRGSERVLGPFLLRRQLASLDPQWVYSMLPVPNMIAWFATRGSLRDRLIWGNRASNMQLDWKQTIADRACAAVSSSVPLLIANSDTGLAHARSRGYRAVRDLVVPNGIDTDTFVPSDEARLRLRAELGLSTTSVVVGLVGRLDPMKGHKVFLKAAELLSRNDVRYRFICVGDGPPEYFRELVETCEALGVAECVQWLGVRSDMPAVYSAMDLLVSASVYGEGFSNAIGEAMACGTPCVVTDIGDSASIVGSCGIVVAPDSPDAIAGGVIELQRSGLRQKGADSRARILSEYSYPRLINSVEQILLESPRVHR